MRLKPDAPLLRINLAHALIGTEDPKNLDEAIDQLKHATVAERENTMAWRLLGQAYAAQGKQVGDIHDLFATAARNSRPPSSPCGPAACWTPTPLNGAGRWISSWRPARRPMIFWTSIAAKPAVVPPP